MLNKVVLMGRLTKEPELKYTPSGTAVASFTLAVDRRFQKNGEERQTDFLSIVAWGNTAEFVAKYFTKGQLIALCGRIETRNWEDNDGAKHYVTEVVADEVYFVESKKAQESVTPKAPEKPAQPTADFEEAEKDDDLPF